MNKLPRFSPHLEANDIIIDVGNANFHDARRRFKMIEAEGFSFVGMGVSGGAEGARHVHPLW